MRVITLAGPGDELPERDYQPGNTPASLTDRGTGRSPGVIGNSNARVSAFIDKVHADSPWLWKIPGRGETSENIAPRTHAGIGVGEGTGFNRDGSQVQHRHQPHPAAEIDWRDQFPAAGESVENFELRQATINALNKEHQQPFIDDFRSRHSL